MLALSFGQFILIIRRIHIRPGGDHAAGGCYIVLPDGLVKGFLDIGGHFLALQGWFSWKRDNLSQ